MSNEPFSIDGLVNKMKNETPAPKSNHEDSPRRRGGERQRMERQEPRSVGRPKNKRSLINKIAKTSYFDDGTHQRIKQVQVFSKVEVKDLILASVIDFLDRNCDEAGRLSPVAERRIESIIDKVYEEYGEYVD